MRTYRVKFQVCTAHEVLVDAMCQEEAQYKVNKYVNKHQEDFKHTDLFSVKFDCIQELNKLRENL